MRSPSASVRDCRSVLKTGGRLVPVTVQVERNQISIEPSSGGLATGLKGPHERSGGLWIGWPGDVSALSAEKRDEVSKRLAELRTVPIYLSPSEVSRYYDGFANSVIWPLFHYLLDLVPLHARGWEAYRKVNEQFAAAVLEEAAGGPALVFVQDYHFALLPRLLKDARPDLVVAQFWHIPWPNPEKFLVCPWAKDLLDGMLGNDLLAQDRPHLLDPDRGGLELGRAGRRVRDVDRQLVHVHLVGEVEGHEAQARP